MKIDSSRSRALQFENNQSCKERNLKIHFWNTHRYPKLCACGADYILNGCRKHVRIIYTLKNKRNVSMLHDNNIMSYIYEVTPFAPIHGWIVQFSLIKRKCAFVVVNARHCSDRERFRAFEKMLYAFTYTIHRGAVAYPGYFFRDRLKYSASHHWFTRI